jgi:hypothetical protein
MKISCIMNTYRRFTCVNRSINFFLNQDCDAEKELIIYNTDTEYPLELSENLLNKNIIVINNNIDLQTQEPYTNIGSIRRDSLSFASGTHYICWDDDDIFLPWHIRQCVDGFKSNIDIWAWKPHTSMFWLCDREPQFACNNMEASILIDLNKLREIGFSNHQGGGEHIDWINTFKAAGKLHIEKNIVPSYCFNWSDKGNMRGHKQSGSINRPDNFEYHKQNTIDYAKDKLTAQYEIEDIISLHIKIIKLNINNSKNKEFQIPLELFQKYCTLYDKA